jgi:uncharacterized repeat protein (TIGR03833 family)
MDPKKLSDVIKGDFVTIKTDSGKLIEGVVDVILTKVHMHQLGIKVRLESGDEGRTQKIHPTVSERQKDLNLINEFNSNLKLDEGTTLEFKASFLYDLDTFEKNGELSLFEKGPHSVAKTIAAFANQRGGTLYIGVKDAPRKIIGLKNDYALLQYKPNADGFLLKLKKTMDSLINQYDFLQCISEKKILHVDDKEICVLKINASKIPIRIKTKNGYEFYVRQFDDSILYENMQSFCMHWYEHMKELED